MALTEKYVSSAAGGGGTGNSAGSPYTFAEMVTEINAGSAAGNRYNILGSFSALSSTTLSGSGTVNAPVIIRGYASAIGDGYLGRTSDWGALIQTNMATLTFGSGNFLNLSGSYIQLESLKCVHARDGNGTLLSGTGCSATWCAISNSNSHASAVAAQVGGAQAIVGDCDVSCTGSTNALAAVELNGSSTACVDSRLQNSASSGASVVRVNSNFGAVVGNAILASAGVGIDLTSTNCRGIMIYRNSIYSQATAAVRTANAVSTGQNWSIRNMLTDSGYAYLGLYAATAAWPWYRLFNRIRDNTTADAGVGDYPIRGLISTDTGGAETDYAAAGSGNLTLIAASPAALAGTFGGNLGAIDPAVSSGGGPPIGLLDGGIGQ